MQLSEPNFPPVISTHALREEGDYNAPGHQYAFDLFLPTPSARRATGSGCTSGARPCSFLPTPSARRATATCLTCWTLQINFYPRPPRGGRRLYQRVGALITFISTHALREEGDPTISLSKVDGVVISTHALREEGDVLTTLLVRT